MKHGTGMIASANIVGLVLFKLSVVAVSFRTNPSVVSYTNVVVMGRLIDFLSDTS